MSLWHHANQIILKISEFFQGLAKHGSEYVRELFLRPSIAGDQVACLGVSEPGAGSDVAQEGVQKDFGLIFRHSKLYETYIGIICPNLPEGK